MNSQLKEKKMYRQGDVLMRRATIPEGAIEVRPRNGRLVLAEGEVTGHNHSIPAVHAMMFMLGQQMFLRSEKQVTLTHQEHGPITIDAGDYAITIQREYTPEEVRDVAD